VHGTEGDTDIATPLDKIDPGPSVAPGFRDDPSRGALRGRHGAERRRERMQLAMPLDTPETFGGA
jgi:hypothetical protein